jgi:HK97 family phage portal protein
VGIRQWAINLLAGRTKNEPDRTTEQYPFPFGWFSGWGKNQPVMKRTPANLRLLSESPIPRRAINVIKDGIAKLEWSVSAINESEQERYQEICNVASNVFRKPNNSDSFRLWLEQIVEDMLVGGEGASEIVKSGDKMRPLRLFPVDKFSVEVYPDWDGKRDSIRYAQRKPTGGYVFLMDAELMYIRMNPRTNTPFGLSPLETVFESVNSFISAHKSAGKQAGNAFVRKILNLGKANNGGGIDEKVVAKYRVYWENEVQGRGMMPIIGADGASVLDLGATDDKALYIEWQRFLIEVIAVSFGISPKKLGQTKDVNRSTADSEDEDTQNTIQSIADNIAEHLNNEIIGGYLGMDGKIAFKFHYAQSLKDQKTQADIDAVYLDRMVKTPDEIRQARGLKAHPNSYGNVLLKPSTMQVFDLRQPFELPPPPDPNKKEPTDPNKAVKARRMKAADEENDDTKDTENEFIAAYLLMMTALLKRGNHVSSVDSLRYVWTPTNDDIQTLSESLAKLKGDSWLLSYNRRQSELGMEGINTLPSDTEEEIRNLADERANQIMDTYKSELSNQIENSLERHSDLTGTEQEKAVLKDLDNWLTGRMDYKSKQIANYEAGESWNQGLFAHDKEHAPETEYYVFPIATNHEDCANIIAGAPYTLDEIPAALPLHPNCPHRYYAIKYDKKPG